MPTRQLFDLSDKQMEFRWINRLSFHRFDGLHTSRQIPDRTTIRTFNERLMRAG
ncbi:transposase [Massilia glaciei]|uniref:Transposase InsH N-terminal domain-containing protein n=1 Tax=Massilia glaciei TaxID=1524097 RepID=A0A2U2HIP9_9BURK|nr:hypothetical protein C7C56_016190 [Massilia glaciei]